MLICNEIKKNDKIQYDKFKYDSNYINSNYTEDKIINIQYSEDILEETVKDFKYRMKIRDLNAKSYLEHLDQDELYYIKDLYYDLSYPYTILKKDIILLEKFYIDIQIDLLQSCFKRENLICYTSNKQKDIITNINKNLENTNRKIISNNKLFILTSYNSKKNNTEITLEFEPKKKEIKEYILNHFNTKHKQTVIETILTLFKVINEMEYNASLIFKIKLLNSKKIQYMIDYLTTIFNKVWLIDSFAFNTINEEYFIVCKEKTKESYLNNVPLITFDYSSRNYFEIANIIYINKIYRKELINRFKIFDKYVYINGEFVNNANKFEFYYNTLNKEEFYKLHLNRIIKFQ